MFPAGTYECRFTSGSIVHTAKAQLNMELLPNMITLKTDPLTVDCALSQTPDVKVTAIILSSTASFDVWWSYMGLWMSNLVNKSKEIPQQPHPLSICVVFFLSISQSHVKSSNFHYSDCHYSWWKAPFLHLHCSCQLWENYRSTICQRHFSKHQETEKECKSGYPSALWYVTFVCPNLSLS